MDLLLVNQCEIVKQSSLHRNSTPREGALKSPKTSALGGTKRARRDGAPGSVFVHDTQLQGGSIGGTALLHVRVLAGANAC